jgi:hypothetical protein
MRSRLAIVSLVALLSLVGCQKLNFEKTYNMQPLEVRDLIFTAPAYQQKVTVTITTTTAGVSSYLCKEDDQTRVMLSLNADKQPPASLLLGSRVSEHGAESYQFEATVPAKTPYVLLLKAGKQATEVKVKVVGR